MSRTKTRLFRWAATKVSRVKTRAFRWAATKQGSARLRRLGAAYGRAFPVLSGGEDAPPGDLERYFDAHVEGRGIWRWRHYFPIYERHLGRLRGKRPHLVEVGVFSGGSLEMWRDYLGDGARITGIDIEPACKAYETVGVSIVIGDQGDPQFWEEFARTSGPIDALIDDGSHRVNDQILTVKAVLPRLRPGAVYICEDTEGTDNGFSRFIDGLIGNLDAGSSRRQADGANLSRTTPFQQALPPFTATRL